MKAKQMAIPLLASLTLALAGCGGTRTVGTPAPADTPTTPLAAVLDAPEQYDGQTVVLKGVLTAQCPSQCWLTYAEGDRWVTIFTPDPKPPKIQPAQPVRVTAAVHKGEKQVVLTAKGIEILPRKRTP